MAFWSPITSASRQRIIFTTSCTCFWLADSAVLNNDVLAGRNHRFSQFRYLLNWVKKNGWSAWIDSKKKIFVWIQSTWCISINTRGECQFNRITIHFPFDGSRIAPGQGSPQLIYSVLVYSNNLPRSLSIPSTDYSRLVWSVISFQPLFTLVAMHYFGNLFRSFITLCEKVHFLILHLQWHLTKAKPCPLVQRIW